MSVATLCHILGKLMKAAIKAGVAWAMCISKIYGLSITKLSNKANTLQARSLSSETILTLFRASSGGIHKE